MQSRHVTRRAFLRDASLALAGIGVLGAGGAAVAGCSRPASTTQELNVLTVPEDSVVTLDGFKQVKKPKKLYKVKELAELGEGVLPGSSDGVLAAALCPGETASPLSTVSLIDLKTGKDRPCLERAIGHSEGYQIFDVACSSTQMVWVESNYLTSDWRVYSAEVSAKAAGIGSALLLDEGDAEFDAPEIAVAGGNAYWIVQPREDGARKGEDSLLKTSGGSAVAVAFTSHGRFNGGLHANGQTVTAMPRAESNSGVYYQLTAFANGAVVSTQVMPRSFRPATALYMDGAFAFSIAASYDYGGGIANVGTYYPMPDGTWLRLTKQPVTPPGLCNGWLYCKSGTRTVLVDRTARRYFTVDPPNDANSYGDYPVCVGDTNAIYTYAGVEKTERDGSDVVKSTQVRRIEPVEIA